MKTQKFISSRKNSKTKSTDKPCKVSPQQTFGIYTEANEFEQKAKSLSKKLSVPFISALSDNYEFLLHFTEKGIALIQPKKNAPGPILIDFVSGKLDHRRRFGGGKNQAIAKAVGYKPSSPPSILDATAGLGHDAFVLATLGCNIMLIERSPILVVLLKDALQRARSNLSEIIARMHLLQEDSIKYMHDLPLKKKPDVVYLDPMFPKRSKSAKVKKEMIALQKLTLLFPQQAEITTLKNKTYIQNNFLNENENNANLFANALKCALKRVVVKRPRIAPYFNEVEPAIQFLGKSSRFDVYLLS